MVDQAIDVSDVLWNDGADSSGNDNNDVFSCRFDESWFWVKAFYAGSVLN